MSPHAPLTGCPLNILVVAAHPDDAEIGMGGTIARLAHQGHRVLICDLTDGSPTPRGDRASRLVEAAAALDTLQPPDGDLPVGAVGPAQPITRVLLNLPNRTLEHSIATRHALAGVIRAHQARVLFVPHWEDAHPDHIAATRIAEDARFDAKLTKVDMPAPPAFSAGVTPAMGPPIYPAWLFYYDISHLRRVMTPSFCMDITGYERAKQRSVKAYRSQFGPWDDGASDSAQPFSPGDPKAAHPSAHALPVSGPAADPGRLIASDFPERLLSYAAFYGSRIGVKFAEAFVTKEPVGLRGVSELTGV
jgi:LmbE family N-acetylglucosaminyl deacetylase